MVELRTHDLEVVADVVADVAAEVVVSSSPVRALHH